MRRRAAIRRADATNAPVVPNDPDLNRRVAEYLLAQNEITGRFVDAMMTRDAPGMTAIADELAAFKAAHRDLVDDRIKTARLTAPGRAHALLAYGPAHAERNQEPSERCDGIQHRP